MMILGVSPFHRPENPSALAVPMAVDPLAWFILDTTVSAGWETMAQKTPAM